MNRQIDEQNRIKSPEIHTSIYEHLVYDKDGILNHWDKNGFFNKWCWKNSMVLKSHLENIKLFISHIMHKNIIL